MANFTRNSRLLKPAEFDAVFAARQRSADRLFTMLYRDNGLGYPRVGLAIAKKRVRLAVDRNRIKRLVRESFRHAAAELPAVDIVVMARDQVTGASTQAVVASLSRHWDTLGGRKENSTQKN
ncbi:MAG: ribonuclease P protein component [Gammaproteobacteria bacterium]